MVNVETRSGLSVTSFNSLSLLWCSRTIFCCYECVITVVLLQLTGGCHFCALILTYFFTQLDDTLRVPAETC